MYGYGYRYNSGLVVSGGGGGGFNTYSLDFDGVDDYVSTSVQNATLSTQTWSASVWANWSALSGNNEAILSTRQNGIGTSIGIDLYMTGNNVLRARVYRGNGGYADITTTIPAIDTWYHAVITFASNTLKLYFDGVLIGSSVSVYTPSTNPLFIGKWGNGNEFHEGLIDEIGIFDIELTQQNVTDIYNGGTPTDLSLLSTPPIDWFRMGDNGSYKSPQWLLPNNENKDKVSNYSLSFDGIDDYIDCGNSAALKPNIITVSCWIKGSANSAFTRIISQDGPTGGADAYGFYVTTATNKIVFAIKTDVTGTVTSATSGVVLDNNWHHLVGTYDGSEVILYVDGVAVGSPSAGTSVLSYGSGTLTIGCFSEPTSLPSYLFNGNIDEVSIFNSIIPIGDLWDGSGEPTTISGAVAHWRMGEEATFSGGVWTVPDSVGSNDGTSNAMTIEDRVGEAPNSDNNALSYNMDLVDRTTDVPT